ncbi:hypothetical protein [Colwellia maritima]|uniref:hypothetical protein n=1 Tax=Colwellia maritima TaxID=2912588 RepID=UPI003B849024
MLSPFFIDHQQLTLTRFPLAQVNRSLQAWDAADEYILNYISNDNSKTAQLIAENTRVAIFNDAFGALTTHFCQVNSVEKPEEKKP